MKKFLLLFPVCFGLGMIAEAQQLTRFAVMDLPRVYMAFFSESRAVRDFEDQSARVQAEIDRMTREIETLRVSRANALAQGNNEQALRVEAEINRRTDYLREYYRTMTEELERIKNGLTQSEAFLAQVYDEIRYVAESEGYTMVLNMRENNGILWYSPAVDITDKIIQSLRNKAGR
ncbi:MAG: OmpH family outer membrane protein [Treponema sp.]|jgi:outer membrane protein|nr:OmpH family outer membrane protein [Treponema sp.]